MHVLQSANRDEVCQKEEERRGRRGRRRGRGRRGRNEGSGRRRVCPIIDLEAMITYVRAISNPLSENNLHLIYS